MSHGSLICQECFTEADMWTVAQSETENEGRAGFVCPNCGSGSFGI